MFCGASPKTDSSSSGADQPIELALTRQSLQLVPAEVLDRKAGAVEHVTHRGRDNDLASSAQSHHPCRGVNDDAAHITRAEFYLAALHARADADLEWSHAQFQGDRCPHRSLDAVKQPDDLIASGLHKPPVVLIDDSLGEHVVTRNENLPALRAKRNGPRG